MQETWAGWWGIRRARVREAAVPYLFLLPALAGLFVFKLLPIAGSLWESLHYETLRGGRVFVGLDNYRELWADPQFLASIGVTLRFNLVITPLQTVAALLLALLVHPPLRGVAFFRTAYFLPMAVSVTVASVIWRLLLDPNAGMVNRFLGALGSPPQPFLAGAGQALGSIVLLASWKGVGYWMIFFLAGLQNIPREVQEAATVDGAGPWQRLLYVTLPLLRRTTAFVLVANTTVNFLLFAPVYLLTQGGPRGATNLLMYEAYKSAFMYFDLGRATAITSILLGIILGIALLELRLLRSRH